MIWIINGCGKRGAVGGKDMMYFNQTKKKKQSEVQLILTFFQFWFVREVVDASPAVLIFIQYREATAITAIRLVLNRILQTMSLQNL